MINKSSLSFLHNLSDEDKIFVNSVADKIYAAENKYRRSFTFFLNEAKYDLAKKTLSSQSFDNYKFFGGYEEAERVMLGIFPPHEEPSELYFPVSALTFSYRRQDKLTHRDFLGTLMGLNVARDTIGDIIVGENSAIVFLTDAAADEAERTVVKVGKIGVKVCQGYDKEIIPVRDFKKISGTVSSLRLDCIVALALKCSRTKAAQLINGGHAVVKGSQETDSSRHIDVGDTFSVRGFGKFILSEIGRSTKKERTFIELKKFM